MEKLNIEWINDQLEKRAEFQPDKNRYVVDLSDVKALLGIGNYQLTKVKIGEASKDGLTRRK